jgi:hypothetical protein
MMNFVKELFCIYWNVHVIFAIYLVMCRITLIDLSMLNHPWIPVLKQIWSQFMKFCVFLSFIYKYFTGNFFHLCSSRKRLCSHVLIQFWYHGKIGFIKKLVAFFSLTFITYYRLVSWCIYFCLLLWIHMHLQIYTFLLDLPVY